MLYIVIYVMVIKKSYLSVTAPTGAGLLFLPLSPQWLPLTPDPLFQV